MVFFSPDAVRAMLLLSRSPPISACTYLGLDSSTEALRVEVRCVARDSPPLALPPPFALRATVSACLTA